MGQTKGMTKIDLTTQTRDALKIIKKDVKKHNRPCKTYDDLLHILMLDYEENKARGRAIKKLKDQLRQDAQKPEAQKDGIPTQAPTDSRSIPTTPPLPVEAPHQCTFHSLDYNDEKTPVRCSKDYDTRGVIHKVTQDVCDQCWARQEARRKKAVEDRTVAKDLECLCRFKDEDRYFCVPTKGKVRPLEYGLKTCQACPDRLTEEKVIEQGIVLQTRRYVTCGATEVNDKVKGPMLFSRNKDCPHQKHWITLDMCEQAQCPLLKKVKVKVT